MITKICTHCRTEKEISGFYKKKSSHDGYDYICKDCYKLWNVEWFTSHHEQALHSMKIYRQENHKRCVILTRRWCKENPDKIKSIRLKQKAKRRNMKCVKLFDNPFPKEVDVDYHHINSILTIPMPKKLHNICSHRNQEEHRNKCNVWLYQIYQFDISKILYK